MPKIKNKRKSGIRSKYAENEENSVETKEESNIAKLLLRELKKGDTRKIKGMLCVETDKIVESIWKLPVNIVEELLANLVAFMLENRLLTDPASLWVQQVLKTNAIQLMNKPNIGDILTPLTEVLQKHIDYQKSLKGVQGNINYILNHTNKTKGNEDEEIISNEDSDDDSIEQFNMHSPVSYSSDDLKDDFSDDQQDDHSEDVKHWSSEEEEY